MTPPKEWLVRVNTRTQPMNGIGGSVEPMPEGPLSPGLKTVGAGL